MLIALGVRVVHKTTGESGTISELLDADMVMVRFDDDPTMDIPVFIDDLRRNVVQEPYSPGSKYVPGKKPPTTRQVERLEVISQYVILKSVGIQIGFEAVTDTYNVTTEYQIWLLNDTEQAFLFECKMEARTHNLLKQENKLQPFSALHIGTMRPDDLSENPDVLLKVQQITTQGIEPAIESELRIKPKNFFKSLTTAPILNKPMYLLLLMDIHRIKGNVREDQDAPKTSPLNLDGLKAYTKAKVEEQKKLAKKQPHATKVVLHSLEALANFNNEIDLHIEHLTDDHHKLSNSDMLKTQMRHFENFYAEALRLGVRSVFVIHGVGEGKLKNTIAARLKERKEVKYFKNEYHHRYGFGATEIVFE